MFHETSMQVSKSIPHVFVAGFLRSSLGFVCGIYGMLQTNYGGVSKSNVHLLVLRWFQYCAITIGS